MENLRIVKISKCSSNDFWYADLVGRVFVAECKSDRAHIVFDSLHEGKWLEIKDLEYLYILTDVSKFVSISKLLEIL